MSQCAKCGTPTKGWGTYCAVCAQKVRNDSGGRFCPVCGYHEDEIVVNPSGHYCGFCTHELPLFNQTLDYKLEHRSEPYAIINPQMELLMHR
jgi:hypothetical protein